MEAEGHYECGRCGTKTVTCETEWGRLMTSHDETLFVVYTCSKCGGTLSLDTDSRRNDKEYGDVIWVE